MKVRMISILVFTGIIILSTSFTNPGAMQNTALTGKESKAIPDNVLRILNKSCFDCHSEPGNGMAQMHVNLSNWDKYSSKKQVAKAKAMCGMVSKGKMPTKNYRKNHPENVPTDDEIRILCNWAKSLKVK